MQYKLILVIFALFLSSYVKPIQGIDFTDCGSRFSVGNIQVEACGDQDTSCMIVSGNPVNISFTINTGSQWIISGSLINHVYLLVGGGVQFNVTAAPEDPCKILPCPLELNYAATFAGQVNVSMPEPVVATLRWTVRTPRRHRHDILVCFEFPVKVLV